jgi:hypothetical protein
MVRFQQSGPDEWIKSAARRDLTPCFEGPFRKGDRVTYPYFAVKDFVFGKGPGEYAFDIPEELKGRIQIIDITDDVTGERKYDGRLVWFHSSSILARCLANDL